MVKVKGGVGDRMMDKKSYTPTLSTSTVFSDEGIVRKRVDFGIKGQFGFLKAGNGDFFGMKQG